MPDDRPTPASRNTAPPGAVRPAWQLLRAAQSGVQHFLHIESSSGVLLLAAAALALFAANSPWSNAYTAFWHTTIGLQVGTLHFERSLDWIVNDGLMAIFFFVVGLEIRREMVEGELSDLRRAALPLLAAVGGMVVPALCYLAIAGAPSVRSGWGVPMATDIAFAVGVLGLLGPRVPAGLRVLLLALAVVDDLGAILVIAVFYSSGVSIGALLLAAAGIGVVFGMQALGVRQRLAYLPPALFVWGSVYAAGIHPTIAGVILGMITPTRAWFGRHGFVSSLQSTLGQLSGDNVEAGDPLARVRAQVDLAQREAISPADGLIETLHPWVAFGIMPLFALANAGVSVEGFGHDAAFVHGELLRVALGSGLGLLLGKPLGVVLASALALRVGVATLPAGLHYRHLLVLGLSAGIGFTMALFIAQLAFTAPPLLAAAKLGVLVASTLAGISALICGRALLSA